MGFNVAPYEGERDPRSAMLSRSRGAGGEIDEMEKLFEQLMGGDVEGDVEELEDFDWKGLWDSFIGEEEGGGEVQQQGSNRPTMFGGLNYPGSPGIHYY